MKAGNKEIKLYDENDTTYFMIKQTKIVERFGFKLPAETADKSSKHTACR